MASTDPSAAQLTVSGRALALQRRQAMAQRGKAAARPAPGAVVVVPASFSSASFAPVLAGLDASALRPASVSTARLRRQALSQTGKASGWVPAVQQTRPTGRGRAGALAEVTRVPAAASAAAGCTCGGGCAVPAQPAQSVHPVPGAGSEALLRQAALAVAHGGGRQAAMQHRRARSVQGARPAGALPQTRPSGRVRPVAAALTAPPKVGEGHTLSGRSVTGTQVDSTVKVTGTEPGQCRQITGTEYLGLEPFQSLCGTRPQPGPAKVGESRTLREQSVTGTELGRAPGVTGDEHGACRAVTGTEYLGREQFESVCGTRAPAAGPHKVSVMSTPQGQTVSGAAMERSAKVTGDEHGAARVLTGTPFQGADTRAVDIPAKVGKAHTRAGTGVTGTEVGPGKRVTGDDRGGCRAVTGSDYVSAREQQAVCEAPAEVAAVAKVGADRTLHGQTVTGTQVGRGRRVTGDEAGGCAPVSGSPYVGQVQFEGFCAAPQRERQQARLPQRTVISAASVSGDRPGAAGTAMTGDERGACAPVSGTPYVGTDNVAPQCPPAMPRYLPRAAPAAPAPTQPAPDAFSIVPPSRQALERHAESFVTGSAFNGQRITGPINKGGGLITGTPEFRHLPAQPGPAAPAPTTETEASAAARLTGEGSQSGTRVSGDAWQGRGRVTGTEGTSSLSRNPSQRGQPRGAAASALRFRDEVERVAVPPSPVTGSAGNSSRGAAITVSGGARA
jgi:hypothetical protein